MPNKNAIHWFRLGLRLSDNEAFVKACESTDHLYPIFIVESERFAQPTEADSERMSAARHRFLMECLNDLDTQLKALNSSLLVLYGDPLTVIQKCCDDWNIDLITMQRELGPYAKQRDQSVCQWAKIKGINVYQTWDNMLYPIDYLPNKVPRSMTALMKILDNRSGPAKPLAKPKSVPPLRSGLNPSDYAFKTTPYVTKTELVFEGGESVGLERLEKSLRDETWVSTFAKPETHPTSLDPSTTVMSPYLAMGCVSPRQFWHSVTDKHTQYRTKTKKNPTEPPVSLLGQIYWRELFYMNAWTIPNFHQIRDNPMCKQIKWDENEAFLNAWTNSQTGYPFIDAVMTQLRTTGWIHHLARHAVACFLTRGDLYISWEQGAKVFKKYLLDGDYALNNANWQWLSCSCFFYQYFRVYSPIKFPQKTDPTGEYIKKWLPVLKLFPKEYIYEPWKAPKSVQERAKCIVGRDYPKPIVDHKVVSAKNIERMKQEYGKRPLAE